LETINGFQILRKVAESNSAEIFHVRRITGKGKGAEPAIKALRPEYAKDDQERQFLENEYHICSGLIHPNVIRIHEVQMSTPRPFLVMDLVQGPNLRTIIGQKRPRLSEGLEWVAQAADGLDYCHQHGYVHCDVKPQNILVGEDRLVRVIDFALAVPQEASLGQYLLRRLTRRRRPGTWSYMSPEQIRRRRLTAASDVYSLGVSLFETVTGRVPFFGETAQALLEQHVFNAPPPMSPLRDGVPKVLEDLVRAMMAKDPLDRPAGMRYVSGKLRSLIPVCRNVN
jgi:eukaryotic-like serine/threonine-protein kinase